MATDEITMQLLRENEVLRQQIAGAPGSEVAELKALREWKSAILGLVRHYGQGEMNWGGDKDGWGAVFEWIKYHLEDRTLARVFLKALIVDIEASLQWDKLGMPYGNGELLRTIADAKSILTGQRVEPQNIGGETRA